MLVNREQKRRSKYNTESELDTDQSELDIIINNNRSEDSEESQLEMANIHLMKEEQPVVEKLRKNSSEHLLPGKLPGFVVKYIELALLLHMMCTLFIVSERL